MNAPWCASSLASILALISSLFARKRQCHSSCWPGPTQTAPTPPAAASARSSPHAILCTGGADVVRKEAWPFYRTISGVRLSWELEEPKGPKGHPCPSNPLPNRFRTNMAHIRQSRPDSSPCGPNADCTNSPGSFQCQVLPASSSFFFITLGLELSDTKVYES